MSGDAALVADTRRTRQDALNQCALPAVASPSRQAAQALSQRWGAAAAGPDIAPHLLNRDLFPVCHAFVAVPYCMHLSAGSVRRDLFQDVTEVLEAGDEVRLLVLPDILWSVTALNRAAHWRGGHRAQVPPPRGRAQVVWARGAGARATCRVRRIPARAGRGAVGKGQS